MSARSSALPPGEKSAKPKTSLSRAPAARSPLRRRLMTAIGVVVLFTQLLTLSGVVFFTYRSEQSQWRARQSEVARSAAFQVEAFLGQLHATLDQVSAFGLDELAGNQELAESVMNNNPALIEMLFLDENGKVKFVASRGPAVLADYLTFPVSNWYQNARAGRVYISSLFISSDNRPYVILSQPTAQQGVAAALIHMQILWDITGRNPLSRTGQLMLINELGQVVAHSNPAVSLANASVLQIPQYAALFASHSPLWSGQTRSLAGLDVVSASVPVSGSSWHIIAEVQSQEVFTNTRTASISLLAAGLLVAVLGFDIISIALERLILRPVKSLRQGALQLSQGRLNHRLQPARQDELGEVVLAFNEMAENLQLQRQELNLRAGTLEALYQVGLGLISQRALKQVLDTVNTAVYQLIPSTWDVHLFTYEREQLEFRASRYADGRLDILARQPSQEDSIYTVARSGQIIEERALSLNAAADGAESGGAEKTGSLICLPLKIGEQVVGVMSVAFTPPRALLDAETRGLYLLCDQAAIAIQNARLDELARRELGERRVAEEALRQLNANLEQRVAQRTQELWVLNEELRQEAEERQAAMEQVRASLEEKEVLLREIHHRVKNNLQVVSSLFNLHAGRVRDPQTIEILRESQNRLRSMALIHEKLYRSEDLSQVDFNAYIRDLAAFLFQAYRTDPGRVSLHLQIEHLDFPIDAAVPCGLLLNELIANALKHAFPDGRSGNLCVELRRLSAERVLLRVADDGIGLPNTGSLGAMPSLGMTLVRALADQLDAELEVVSRGGVTFNLSFPLEE